MMFRRLGRKDRVHSHSSLLGEILFPEVVII